MAMVPPQEKIQAKQAYEKYCKKCRENKVPIRPFNSFRLKLIRMKKHTSKTNKQKHYRTKGKK